jgi:hypothetical protein
MPTCTLGDDGCGACGCSCPSDGVSATFSAPVGNQNVGGGCHAEHMFGDLGVRRVESELVELAGHLAAATCRFLQLLAEFDRRDGWAGDGVRSCAHWLNWRVGLSLRTAREQLRVAHALTELPAITEAFAGRRISYSKARAMTRIATPKTERGLLNIALNGTASHVETVVAGARARLMPQAGQPSAACSGGGMWTGRCWSACGCQLRTGHSWWPPSRRCSPKTTHRQRAGRVPRWSRAGASGRFRGAVASHRRAARRRTVGAGRRPSARSPADRGCAHPRRCTPVPG